MLGAGPSVMGVQNILIDRGRSPPRRPAHDRRNLMRYNKLAAHPPNQEAPMLPLDTEASDQEMEIAEMIAGPCGHAAITEGARWYGKRCDLFRPPAPRTNRKAPRPLRRHGRRRHHHSVQNAGWPFRRNRPARHRARTLHHRVPQLPTSSVVYMIAGECDARGRPVRNGRPGHPD